MGVATLRPPVGDSAPPQAREEAAASERLRRVLERVGAGVLLVGSDGRVRFANEKALDLLDSSRARVLGRGLTETWGPVVREDGRPFLPEDHPALVAVQTKQSVSEVIMGVHRSSAEDPSTEDPAWLSVSAEVQLDSKGDLEHVVCTLNDITDRKCLEEQLQHAQKLETVGRLAGGVAHDYNNLLTVITGHLHVLAEEADGTPQGQNARVALSAAHRSAALTKRLLAFVRHQVIEPRNVDVNARLRSLADLMDAVLDEEIELEVSLSNDAGNVRIDPTQLEQVVLNLVLNARDSLEEGGRIALSTRHEVRPADGGPRDFVCIEVSDDGAGISEEHQARIFEPFFTTKPEERGTGLGLSTVRSIIEKSEGTIEMKSRVGNGTSFFVYLPWQPHGFS